MEPMIFRDNRPAEDWESEAYPLGNGRLGCMVFGGMPAERIQFNVDSLWTGNQNFDGGYDDTGMGAYQNFGDLYVHVGGEANEGSYRRELDIANALASVGYTQNEVSYLREVFCSHPADAVVARFTASEPGALTGSIELVGGHGETTQVEDATLTFAGQFENGQTYEARVRVRAKGGAVSQHGDQLRFEGCDSLCLFLVAGTNYVMDYGRKFMGEAPGEKLRQTLAAVSEQDVDSLLQAHQQDHHQLFNRLRLDLGPTPEAIQALPTRERLARVREGSSDPGLENLMFQYGRYLMIGSSRPGTLPANLQGIWNHSNQPPWQCDYHSNINLQMNYWPVETTNLSECHTPLFDLLMASREPFREATRMEFGEDIRGFTIRTSHNPFGGMGWKWNIPASAWYARHFWEHYAFTMDKTFLREVGYPYLKEVCEYWEDHLKELPDGQLVIPDGWSPEQGPREDGVSHDQQLVWDLFTNTIEASKALGEDDDFRETLQRLRERLLGPRIGSWGQLQEWMDDKDDPNNQHRHVSHLYAVYPAYQISPVTTPEFAEAARVSLDARGDKTTGWSKAWKISLWARLGDGNRSHRILCDMLAANIFSNGFDKIYAEKTFQIDANFGFAAGVCELLLQSHAGEIHLLPALPEAWSSGSVSGLLARGGVEVDMTWDEGVLVSARLQSTQKQQATVRIGDETFNLSFEPGTLLEWKNNQWT